MNPLVLVALVTLAAEPAAPAAPAASSAASRTLTFQEVLTRMETQNLDLQAARARLAQAQELSAKAWSGYLPQITAGASYTRNRD
ncbi:MAG TPA: TolC family protein, partial [Myxococcaceae bacterium]